ncbi:MAG: hypothetical protein Q7T21_10750 [Gallionella sp.]|nr:hypothetical protein [Gallionella sp.]
MIDGLITGKVLGDPERRMDKGGKPFVVAKVRAQASLLEPVTFAES